MNILIEQHLSHVLKHLYINPLEKCNLRCAICYTRKTSPILSKESMLEFIDRYQNVYPLETITFCGGEVFALPYFVEIVNILTSQNIFVQIITNGTIDRLTEFSQPNAVNLIVSIDGMEEYHDKNRGKGNFNKSLSFLKKAKTLGFHLSIFTIVTKQNYPTLNTLEDFFREELEIDIPITYHPRKPPSYLMHHPVSNIVGETQGFDFLNQEEMISLLKNRRTFPPKDLGCYQIAVTSDGKVYGCCEGITAIGKMSDDIGQLGDQMKKRLEVWEKINTFHNCLGCTSPDFICGMQQYLSRL